MIGVSCFIGGSNKSIFPEKFSSSSVSPFNLKTDNLNIRLRAVSHNVGYKIYEDENFSFICFGDIYTPDVDRFIEGFISSYTKRSMKNYLRDTNGVFSIYFYDKKLSKLIVISDRYGLKSTYMETDNKKVKSFSNDLNTIVFREDVQHSVCNESISTFLSLGHLLENRTMFEGISRVSPATIHYVDLKDGTHSSQVYWKWSNIKKRSDISFDEAVDTLYVLFKESIGNCLKSMTNDRLAVCLSGGLDSRVLLAEAVKQFDGEIQTFTFGKEGCLDFELAKKVADIAGVKSNFFTVDESNWFDQRVEGVLTTGGMFNITHMHALVALEEMSAFSNYMLNGYLGDAVLGGSYLLREYLDTKNNFSAAQQKYGTNARFIDLENDYYDFETTDPSMVISNRGNRFTSGGTDLISDKLHNLKPFMDSRLLDFVYSLPDAFRFKSRLYNAMLLKYYPDYFKDIPWQNTGKVISVDWSEEGRKLYFKRKVRKLISNTYIESAIHRFYAKNILAKKNFVDYHQWMREERFMEYLTELSSRDIGFDIDQVKFSEIVSDFKEDYSISPDEIGCWVTIFEYFSALKIKKQR
ncbi:asparagine synthetase B family protein [Vibrio sp. Isolate32]|uniref:asparagine synthase-related protein n=1 Tax=Vibrio sp. Isolate32 TaxID=2908538 RepID=UPI001EFEA515|nr:asparagine synthetase B family protein [Vibrio sp. Isolate32]MCG9553875.1 asparagine synthetase B family protein [Vibrio sp. Isolate32]